MHVLPLPAIQIPYCGMFYVAVLEFQVCAGFRPQTWPTSQIWGQLENTEANTETPSASQPVHIWILYDYEILPQGK